MFKAPATSEDNIEEYKDTVTSYISMCVKDVTVTKTITVHPNQKPWLTAEVHALLKAWDTAFNAGNETELRSARANVSRAIRKAADNDSDRALLDRLNHFYTCFEELNNVPPRKTHPELTGRPSP